MLACVCFTSVVIYVVGIFVVRLLIYLSYSQLAADQCLIIFRLDVVPVVSALICCFIGGILALNH